MFEFNEISLYNAGMILRQLYSTTVLKLYTSENYIWNIYIYIYG
jgi:hypothetical protein